jgi:hypothetical protein
MARILLLLIVLLFPFHAYAVDTVTSSTVSSTVSSSSNTVSTSTGNTVVDKTPPTASSPSVVVNNSDVCVTGVSGALQTSVFGVSGGSTVRDKNCERLKLARSLYAMGLKVAGVSMLCQDQRVFDAMWAAGTPCPFEGQIGNKAKVLWLQKPNDAPEGTKIRLAAIQKAKIAEEKRLEAEEKKERENQSDDSTDTWPPE